MTNLLFASSTSKEEVRVLQKKKLDSGERVYAQRVWLGPLTLGSDTSDGGLATELEGTLLAVVGALCTGSGALVTAVARDTHCRLSVAVTC